MSKHSWLTSRREFLVGSLAAGISLTLSQRGLSQQKSEPSQPDGPFKLPELPYPLDGLEPFLSKEQMEYHYGKHHAGYIKKLNALVAGKPEAKQSLRELVIGSEDTLFNNAAQAWNHTFFWNCMAPKGGGEPQGKLREAIDRDFGNLAGFRQLFSDTAVNLFGSGWAWLATDKAGTLHVMALSNAANPLKFDKEPVETFWSKVNWDFASKTYEEATKKA
jgi:Fe-Mn family superoxide dismutase